MRGKTQASVSDLFDQAVQTFETAMQSGVRIQEETTKLWTDMLNEADSIQELQSRARNMISEAIPAAQKNAEQCMMLLDKSYHTSLDLMQKAMDSGQGGEAFTDIQGKVQGMWESMLTALRTNAQAIVQVNSRAMESWSQMTQRDATAMAQEMHKAARAGAAEMGRATGAAESAGRAGAAAMKSAGQAGTAAMKSAGQAGTAAMKSAGSPAAEKPAAASIRMGRGRGAKAGKAGGRTPVAK